MCFIFRFSFILFLYKIGGLDVTISRFFQMTFHKSSYKPTFCLSERQVSDFLILHEKYANCSYWSQDIVTSNESRREVTSSYSAYITRLTSVKMRGVFC